MLGKLWKVKMRYLLVWPGIGNTEDIAGTDMIVAQSFGRNSYPDGELTLRVGYCLEALDKDDRKMFLLLERTDFDPGEANNALALELASLMSKFSIRVAVVQWEIGYALWKNYPGFFNRKTNDIEIVWPDRKSDYMASGATINRALQIAKSGIFKKIACLSHKRMEARIFLMIVKKVLPATDSVLCIGSDTAFFPKKSIQWWTRGRIRWLIRESLVRAHHVLKGWV